MNFYQNSPLTPETKTSRVKSIGILVAIIIIIIIIVVVVFYRNANQSAPRSLDADLRARMIEALNSENITPPTAEQRANMVEALKSENITPPTAEQRANMIKALESSQ